LYLSHLWRLLRLFFPVSAPLFGTDSPLLLFCLLPGLSL
jgi:hypothetical protein